MKKIIVISILALILSVSITTIYAQNQYEIPSWVKGVAGFWAEGKITDNEFGEGLSFLINSEIIKVPLIQELQNELTQLKAENSELRSKLNLPQDDISFTNSRFVDDQGNRLTHAEVNQQMQITADVTNNNNHNQDFVYYIKVRETDDESWLTGSLSAGQSFSPALSWIPTDAGTFTVDIHLFDNIQNKNKLAESLTTQITIEEPAEDSISVKTDKTYYKDGNTVLVTGEVRELLSGYPISLIVTAPNGEKVTFAQLDVGSDKKFSHEFTAGGERMRDNGTYTIAVLYGTESRTAETTFEFSLN